MEKEDVLVIPFIEGFIVTNKERELVFDGAPDTIFKETLRKYGVIDVDSFLKEREESNETEHIALFTKWYNENVKD